MTPELFHRLARAVDVGGASPEQRERVVDAAQYARTFEDLPDSVQDLVLQLETPPSR